MSSLLVAVHLVLNMIHKVRFLVLILCAASGVNTSAGSEASLDGRCNQLSEKFVARSKDKPFEKDYTLIDVESFYSNKVDACIHIEHKVIGVELKIYDLSQSIVTDGPNEHYLIVNCSIDGAHSIVLDRVRELKGRVWSVPYIRYTDDGFGGKSSGLETPPKPYTKEDCNMLLNKWIKILK